METLMPQQPGSRTDGIDGGSVVAYTRPLSTETIDGAAEHQPQR